MDGATGWISNDLLNIGFSAQLQLVDGTHVPIGQQRILQLTATSSFSLLSRARPNELSCTLTTKEGEANAIRGVPLLRAAALHFFPGAGAELSYVKLLWLVATSHYYRLTAPSAIGVGMGTS